MKICDLYFEPNGGTVQPATKGVPENYSLGFPEGHLPTPVRTGYIFQGWFDNKDGGTKYSETTLMPLNDITLYAHWSADESTFARIISQPQGANVCYGSAHALVVRATGVNLKYQW